MPEPVEECVRSVKDENPDMDESRAYAICNAKANRGELAEFDPSEAGEVDLSGGPRVHVQRRLRSPAGPVDRVENEDGSVRYENIMLLAPGEWTDAASRETIYYDPEAIANSAENWIDDQVNLYHEPGQPLSNVGHVDTASVEADDQGRLYGDIILHGRTSASEDAIGLMDLALESDGDHGIGGPSVEIPEDRTEWDPERGMNRMVEMSFSGVALVMHPASETVAFDSQFEERAVAMARAMNDAGAEDRVAVMTAEDGQGAMHGETFKRRQSAQGHMGNTAGDEDSPFASRLRTLQDKVEETAHELQNETDMALNAVDEYLADEDNGPEDDLSAMVAWASEAADEPVAVAVEEAVNAYLEASGESLDEATVGDFADWAAAATEETGDDEAGEESGEEGDMDEDEELEHPDEDNDMAGLPDESAEAIANTLESVVETVEQAVDALESQVGEVGQDVAEMQAELEETKRRLAEVEDEPVTRSLAGGESEAETEPDPLEKTGPHYYRDRGRLER